MRTLLVFCLAVAAQADPLSDVFARMDRSAQSFKGMTADLKQTVHTAIVNDDAFENGTIRLRRDKGGADTRILVDFTNPDQKTISVEGKEVRIYLRKSNEEQVYDIGTRRAALDDAMLLGFGATSGDVKAKYEVSYVAPDQVHGEKTSHIKLIPKSKEVLQQVKQADLWISDAQGVPLQQKLTTSNSGDYTEFTYSNLKFTGGLSDKDLRLNTPKNVKIQQVGK